MDSEGNRCSAEVAQRKLDQKLSDLQGIVNVSFDLLKRMQGCAFKKAAHITFQTEHRKWYKIRKAQLRELQAILEAKNITSRRRFALLEQQFLTMKKSWENEEKKPHDTFFNVFCRSQKIDVPAASRPSHSQPDGEIFEEISLEEKDNELYTFWDPSSAYLHDTGEEILGAMKELIGSYDTSFQKLVCPICKKRQPKIIYVHGKDLCHHFYACEDCDKNKRDSRYCANKDQGTKRFVPDFKARCSGCKLEVVNTYCQRCKTMEYCSSCSEKKDERGEYLHKCTHCYSWKTRKLITCQLPADDD